MFACGIATSRLFPTSWPSAAAPAATGPASNRMISTAAPQLYQRFDTGTGGHTGSGLLGVAFHVEAEAATG